MAPVRRPAAQPVGTSLAELKIPAEPGYIPVARRLAVTLGSLIGFSLDDLDELGIAVAQACDSAIEVACEAFGEGGSLKLTFGASGRGLEVEVHALGPRSPQALPRPPAAARDEEARRIAQQMIRMFVDDFTSQLDTGAGQVRYRMVKYLIG
ncbi:MAG: ATP-binding protein [Candidatus Dormibacteraceae bacterium]